MAHLLLRKKLVMIIGADGLGETIACQFLNRKAKVAICDMVTGTGQKMVTQLGWKYGEDVAFFQGDVFEPELLKKAFHDAAEKYGQQVDTVIVLTRTACEVDWEKTVDLSLKGVIRTVYLALEIMGLKHGGEGGTIVTVASSLALKPMALLPTYSAVNAAVVTFTRCISHEMFHKHNGVRIMGVCPGKIKDGFWQKRGVWSNPEVVKATEALSNMLPGLEWEEVGVAVVKAVRQGTNGSIWQLESGVYEGCQCSEIPEVEGVKSISLCGQLSAIESKTCGHIWGSKSKCDCCVNERELCSTPSDG